MPKSGNFFLLWRSVILPFYLSYFYHACTNVGTSKKSTEWLVRRAQKLCQLSCADSRHKGSPFVLHPVLSAVSVPFRRTAADWVNALMD